MKKSLDKQPGMNISALVLAGLLALCFMLSSLAFATSFKADKNNQTFVYPMIKGLPVSACYREGTLCGWAAAHAYCHMKGYARAKDYTTLSSVTEAYIISNGRVCKGESCKALDRVRCTKPYARSVEHKSPFRGYKNFSDPRIDGYALDHCYANARHCGRPAARAYCKRQGFRDVQEYGVLNNAGVTKRLGGKGLCKGDNCNTFSYILCWS